MKRQVKRLADRFCSKLTVEMTWARHTHRCFYERRRRASRPLICYAFLDFQKLR